MAKTVTIPTGANPFVVVINNVRYVYKAGDTVEVPDEVAALIEDISANKPKKAFEDGVPGQVWTRQREGGAWADIPEEPAATVDAAGVVKMGEAVADATDETDVVEQLNALIAALVAAGILAEYIPPIPPEDPQEGE